MRTPLKAAIPAGIALALLATPLAAAISLSIGEPGFYGRIDIGGAPPPVLVYREPVVVIQQPPQQVIVQPIYLRVAPGHANNWKHHCSAYNACGRPVYFVQDDWYNDVYAPHYRKQHGHGNGGKGKGNGKGQGNKH